MTDIVYEACKVLKLVLQARAPYDTGNLAMNSIRIDRNRGRVIIGGESAEYAVYTNEPWTSEKWRGANNPNEGWIDRAIKEALPIIQRMISRRASEDDVKKVMNYYNGVRLERKNQYIAELKKKKEKKENK